MEATYRGTKSESAGARRGKEVAPVGVPANPRSSRVPNSGVQVTLTDREAHLVWIALINKAANPGVASTECLELAKKFRRGATRSTLPNTVTVRPGCSSSRGLALTSSLQTSPTKTF